MMSFQKIIEITKSSLLAGLLCFLVFGCDIPDIDIDDVVEDDDEEEVVLDAPTANTQVASNVTATSAEVSGEVSGDEITSRGIVFGTNSAPTLENGESVTSGSGAGPFSVTLDDLDDDTQYFARAFATNASGTSYGTDVNFTTVPLDDTPPTVVSVSPADGATGVSIDESIQITFSEDIDPGDVRTTKFKLYENGSERSIGVSLSGSVVTMRYSGELASGSSYEIRIDDAVFDLNQNKMEEEFRSTFTVESSAPEVVSHNISQSQTDVDIHTAVSVTFNEDIDASSINSTTVQLIERNRGTQVDGTYSVSGKTITFTPSEPLREFATDHAVVLYPGIRSTAGGEMVATVDDWVYIFSFFTEDLSEDYFYSVEAVVPLNGSAKFLGIRSTSDYTVVLWNGYSNDSRKQWRFIEQNGTYIFYNRQVENNGDGRFLEGTAPGDGNPSRLTTRAPNGGYYGGQRWNISYVDGRFDEGRVYFRNNFNQGYFSSLNIDAEPVDPPEDHCEWKLVRRGSVN